MKPHETNGGHDPPGRADPLATAEELRAALADAATKAARLVAAPAPVEEGEEGAVGGADQPEATEPRHRRCAMTALVTQRVHRLADSLAELKVKVRAALATELAGAVGPRSATCSSPP